MANEVALSKQQFRGALTRILDGGKDLLPKHMTPGRMLELVYAAATKNPKLMQCTPASIGICLTTCSEMGLEPGDVRGHVYLIPRENRKAGIVECTLQIGYKGYAELGRRSGEISSIDASPVYKGEPFTVSRGAHPDIQHEWRSDVDRSDASLVAAYAVARMKDGSIAFEVLTRQEIDARRARSMSRDNGPWVTDYSRMARKTAIRALFTGGLVPMSAEIVRALDIDNDDNDDRILTVQAEKPSSTMQSLASSSLKALAQQASQNDDIPEQQDEDQGPLGDLRMDLAKCSDADGVTATLNAWLKASDESLHGDIKSMCRSRAQAFQP